MILRDGARLGPYEILAPAGAGGMGEVYKARDTRLDRIVAIKVLANAAGARPEARQRFEREARAVSAINHPHICSLFDIGQQDGIDYLVLEFLEGETLAERLRKGALPIEHALRLGIQIAGALEAAHGRGIIHRDLKPANIILTTSGAKVLDFGLAKMHAQSSALVSHGSILQTLTTPLTGAGTIVGTLQYMAPEQLEGKDADARTDLFAFGTVLYEVISGRRAFHASSHAALISSIMTAEPAPLPSLQPLASPSLDHLVRTCLAKDPADRWQSAHDLLVQLKWIAGGGSEGAQPLAPQRQWRERLSWIVAGMLALVVIALAISNFRQKPVEAALVQFQVQPPPDFRYEQFDLPVASPDGTHVAFVGSRKAGKPALWIQSLDSIGARQLPGTEGAAFPFWSPDSRSLAYFADAALNKVGLRGTPPQIICKTGPALPGGGTWNREGIILFGMARQPLRSVQEGGGDPRTALRLDTVRHEIGQAWPSFLPDNRHFLYSSRIADSAATELRAGSLDSSETRLVLANAVGSYVPPGWLLFTRQQTLMAQSFDSTRLRAAGDPLPVVNGVGTSLGGRSTYSVSQSGLLVWRTGAHEATRIAAYTGEGRRTGTVAEGLSILQMLLSPDEKLLALEAEDFKTHNRDTWLVELATGITTRFTSDQRVDRDPIWSPDSHELIFARATFGRTTSLYRKHIGGSSEELLFNASEAIYTTQWLREPAILFQSQGGGSFYRLPLTGERKPSVLVQSEFENDQFTVSGDGQFIAYNSNESGRWEVYVASFPSFTNRRQISNSGGCQALWRKDGKGLFYLSLEGKLMSVNFKAAATLEAGIPSELFSVPLLVDPKRNQYAVLADGKKFLFLESPELAAAPMVVVLNWTAGLRH
jgi:hypothetical protein